MVIRIGDAIIHLFSFSSMRMLVLRDSSFNVVVTTLLEGEFMASPDTRGYSDVILKLL